MSAHVVDFTSAFVMPKPNNLYYKGGLVQQSSHPGKENKIFVFPFSPLTVRFSHNTEYKELKAPGSPWARYTWGRGGAHSISFTLFLDSGYLAQKNNVRNHSIAGELAFLESLTLPEEDFGSLEELFTLDKPIAAPPALQFVLGDPSTQATGFDDFSSTYGWVLDVIPAPIEYVIEKRGPTNKPTRAKVDMKLFIVFDGLNSFNHYKEVKHLLLSAPTRGG